MYNASSPSPTPNGLLDGIQGLYEHLHLGNPFEANEFSDIRSIRNYISFATLISAIPWTWFFMSELHPIPL